MSKYTPTLDRMAPRVMGVGFIGIGPHKASNQGKPNPTYNLWGRMLARCYSGRYPEYVGVSVCKRWHNFQYFATDVEAMPNFGRKGYALDKDVIKPGSKQYSPRTCAFVPGPLNTAIQKGRLTRETAETILANPRKYEKLLESRAYVGLIRMAKSALRHRT